MKKFYNILKVILISLALIVGIGYLVLYIFNVELAKEIMAKVVEYANKPLPVIGVSVLVLCGLIWKIFIHSRYGKITIEKIKAENKETYKKLEEEKEKTIEIISFYQNEIDSIFDTVFQLCNASANKKIKALGEELKEKETSYKNQLREKFNYLLNESTSVLIKTKKEIYDSLVEMVKNEMEKKYGEEGKETINSIAKTEKI